MKVFLSWSGRESKQVALALRKWLPSVIQAIEPWMSSEDIERGARWSSELATELKTTNAGIICMTPDNREAVWLNYEAGALSKSVDTAMVCTYLHRMKHADLKGPLVQFQGTESNKEETYKLLQTLNKAVNPKPLSEVTLLAAFELWWPRLESELASISSSNSPESASRSTQEMLEDILDTVRDHVNLTISMNKAVLLELEGRRLDEISYRYQNPTIFPSGLTFTMPTPPGWSGVPEWYESARQVLGGNERLQPPKDEKGEGGPAPKKEP
jgi:hypothetical protein